MERYLIFGVNCYDALGGFKDFKVATNDLVKGIDYIKQHHFELVPEDSKYGDEVHEFFNVFDTIDKKWYEARVNLATETVYLEEAEFEYSVI